MEFLGLITVKTTSNLFGKTDYNQKPYPSPPPPPKVAPPHVPCPEDLLLMESPNPYTASA